MTWDKSVPKATSSLATSQPLISGNFTQIEAVLGSSTLSAGITKAQGGTFYVSDTEFVKPLVKTTTSAMYTNWGGSNNPSWTNAATGLTGITNLTGLISATSLTNIGTIKTGTWSATTIDDAYGGTGETNLQRGTIGAIGDSANVTVTFTLGFANTTYTVLWGSLDGTDYPTITLLKKNATDFVVKANNGSPDNGEYLAIGTR